MFVENLKSPRTGNSVANQFKITDSNKVVFQSYDTTICTIDHENKVIYVDEKWCYSPTTLKYFKQFLLENTTCFDSNRMSKKELQKIIDGGKTGAFKVILG